MAGITLVCTRSKNKFINYRKMWLMRKNTHSVFLTNKLKINKSVGIVELLILGQLSELLDVFLF